MSSSSKMVAVIIPNWNGAAWLPQCLMALRVQSFRDFQLIVVDNGSSDHSIALIQTTWPDARILRNPANRGFAAAANQGIAASTAPYVALLNNDTVPEPEWLAALVITMENAPPDVGSVASLMLQMDQPHLVDSAGDELTRHGFAHKRGHGQPAGRFTTPGDVISACAGAALYRRTALKDCGGFDENFFAYLEDVDWGLRGQWLGHRCAYVPAARVLHRGHGSATPQGHYVRWSVRNRLLLIVKNWPTPLFLTALHHLLYGQFYLLCAQRRPTHFLAGWFDFLRLLPYALKERRALMTRRRVSPNRIIELLSTDPGEPPLWRAIWNRLTIQRAPTS